MRFSSKLILGTTIIIAILFSIGGSIMIRENFKISYEKEVNSNIEEHTFYKASLELNIKNKLENAESLKNEDVIRILERLNIYENGDYKIKNIEKGKVIYGNIENEQFTYGSIGNKLIDEEVENYCKEDMGEYLLKEVDKKMYMYLKSDISFKDNRLILLDIYDINSPFLERSRQNNYYIVWLLVLVSVYIVLIIIFSKFLLSPVKRLNETSKKIANGNYKERTGIESDDEIGELSRSFDTMAASIEMHIKNLEEDIQNREEFITNFSHELKTPMTSIIGYSKILMEDEELDSEIKLSSARYIYLECRRLDNLSKKLLDLMKVKEINVKKDTISPTWLKERIEFIMKPTIKKYNGSLVCDMEEKFIVGDFDLIVVLIKNLIENGLKAGENGQEIKLIGRRNNSGYKITVIDNGEGISKEEIKKIINPFYMIDKSRSKEKGNTGIGLSICDQIAKFHNTKLEFKSEVYIGTEVSFILEVLDE